MAWQAIQMEPIDEMLASFLVNVVLWGSVFSVPADVANEFEIRR